MEALRAKRRKIYRLFLVSDNKAGARRKTLEDFAAKSGIEIRNTTLQELTDLVGHPRHQGIGAMVGDYPFCSLDSILSIAQAPPKVPLVLVLDQIVDPQNLGAITRTSQCAGVHGLIIAKNRSAPPSAAASKASAGALEHMPMACVTNLVNALNQLKKHGLWIAGADHQARTQVFDADLAVPLALVIGSEEKGIRPLVKKQCDYTVAVPQIGSIGSLNASVAAAVILYEIFRQRRTGIASHLSNLD